MENKNKSVKEFLAANTSFKLSKFETFFEDYFTTNKQFLHITEDDIPELTKAIRDKYRNEFWEKPDINGKSFIISKISYIVGLIESGHLSIYNYRSIPGFDFYIINLFFTHLVDILRSEINEMSKILYEGKSSFKHSETFSYGEVANLIHLLKAEGFFRAGIEQQEIAFAFHQLTGYTFDTINNNLSEFSFSRKKALLNVRKDLQPKLDRMSMKLLSTS